MLKTEQKLSSNCYHFVADAVRFVLFWLFSVAKRLTSADDVQSCAQVRRRKFFVSKRRAQLTREFEYAQQVI
jgi:hypothetical protein